MPPKLKIVIKIIKPLVQKHYGDLDWKSLTRDEFYTICREAGVLSVRGVWTVPNEAPQE